MREITIELAGQKLTLQANFKASRELAEQVYDPMDIARELALTNLMQDRGINYTPKWQFDIDNVPTIIYIGLKAAGSALTQAQVQDLVFEEGFYSAQAEATRYLTHIIGPQPEEAIDTPKESAEEEKP